MCGVEMIKLDSVWCLGAVEVAGAAETLRIAGGDLVGGAGDLEPEGSAGQGAFGFEEGGVAAEPVGEALEAHLLSCLGGWILGFDGLFVSVSVVILPLLAG